MRLSSSLRSRRNQARSTQTTTQMITFRLQQDWFALPVQVAYRVIPQETLYGGNQTTDTRLALYQDQEFPVINLHHRLFKEPPLDASPEEQQSGYLLLIQHPPGELMGLSLDSQPALRRIPQSAFKALPANYLSQSNLRCLKALIVTAETDPPIFLIDLEQLLTQQPPLLPTPEDVGSSQS